MPPNPFTSLSGRIRRALVAGWILVAAGMAVYAVHLVAGVGTGPAASGLLDGWLSSALVLSGGVSVMARVALVREDRLGWTLIGVGSLSWAGGDIWWWRVLSGLEVVPYPSPADWLYLAFYPLVYAGILLLLRARVRRFGAGQWLDAAAAALIVAAVGASVVLPAILDAGTSRGALALGVNLAYPLGDLLLLGLVIALTGLVGLRAGRHAALLAVGCAAFTVADATYLREVATGGYTEGGALDLFWPLGLVALGLAAWQPARRGRGGVEGARAMALPLAVASTSVALLVLDHYTRAPDYVVWAAAAALALGLMRGALLFRENAARAVTDALTGLPNRRLFADRADQAILRARRTGDGAAVMLVDLDRFKEVNDTLGHEAGDLLLCEVARRLCAALRESDTIARLGGDEFAVLLPSASTAADAETVAGVLAEVLRPPVALDGLNVDIEASVGIALFPDHGRDASELLQRADVAMYRAKADGQPARVYGSEDDANSPQRLALLADLREALEGGDGLVMHYQPQVSLESGDVIALEALMRWEHPQRGLLRPAEFIPAAERTALIGPLTRFALDRALADCADLVRGGMRVSVNVSARTLMDARFPGEIAEILARRGVPAERLELEITETALMANPRRALEVLRRLDAMGPATPRSPRCARCRSAC